MLDSGVLRFRATASDRDFPDLGGENKPARAVRTGAFPINTNGHLDTVLPV
jgi:hypothetical protein